MPEVIVWGQRFFAFHAMLPEREDRCTAEYREVFAYFVPPDGYEPDLEGKDK